MFMTVLGAVQVSALLHDSAECTERSWMNRDVCLPPIEDQVLGTVDVALQLKYTFQAPAEEFSHCRQYHEGSFCSGS